MFDLVLGHTTCQFVIRFAITQIEACLKLRVEAIADVGRDAFTAASRVILITVSVGIGQRNVVIKVSQYLSCADLAFAITITARFVPHLQRRSVVARMRYVVDGAAQGQRAGAESIGAAQHFGAAQPQRFEQFVGSAARARQRQAVEHDIEARTVGAGRPVDCGTPHRHFGAIIAR